MPVFIPVNPPPAPRDIDVNAPNGKPPEALLLRIEEQVRHLVQEYKSALRTWADSRYEEAYTSFGELCSHTLLSQPQEAHVERECSAYCNEYGGMGIERLRMLVCMNAGRLHILSNGGPDLCMGLEELGCLDLARPQALSTTCDESVLHRALDWFLRALQFDTAEVPHYLATGQCALLLAQHDLAISMFAHAFSLTQPQSSTSLVDAKIDDWVLFSKNAGPWQWWCVVASIQAFLMRGDVELAESISRHALAVYPDHCYVLPRQSRDEDDVVGSGVPAPPARRIFALPRVPALPERMNPQMLVIETCSGRSTVSLDRLGSDLLVFYERHISDTACSYGDKPFACVEFRIDRTRQSESLVHEARLSTPDEAGSIQDSVVVHSEPVTVDTDCIGNTAEDVLDDGNGNKTATTIPDTTTSGNEKTREDDNLAVSAGYSSNNESPRGTKRQGSLSEDEMPVKRRSARFSERTTSASSGVVSGVNGTSLAQGVAGGSRITPARSAARKVVAMSLDSQGSSALESANENAAEWLKSIGVSSGSAFKTLLEKSASVASTFAQQHNTTGSKQSTSPVGHTQEESRIFSFWCLPDKNGSSAATKDGTIVSSEDRCYNTSETNTRYFDSLKLLFQTQPSSTADHTCESQTLSDHYEVSIDECCHILDNNSGAMDLLIRYFDKLVEVFYSSPVGFLNSTRLMHISFTVASTFHETLLDRAHRKLSVTKPYDDHSTAIQCATFMLLVLASGLIDSTVPNADSVCSFMRSDWVRLVGDATIVLGLSADDLCVLRYRFVEAWTMYEASLVSDSMDCASSNIAECQKLMEESLRRDVDISIARCSFSGAPVTLSLIVQRREHIFLFSELLKAEKLASIGDRHATALLKSIIKPFSDTANGILAFSQTISATRLLASLHHQAAEKDEEAALAMYELFLYTSQLLEHNLDVPPAPLKQIIEHCVDCLQRIRELSDTNNSVQRRFGISSNISTMQRLVTQMVSLALAFLSHFLIDPSVDYPASLTEARFIGLSLWLVAALTSTQNRVYESSAARDMSMYDAAEISGISDDDAKVPSGDSSTGDNEAPDPRIHFMSALHSLLGERGLCTAADGALLLQMLSTCQERLRLDQGNDIYWDVVAACLRCLFDIKLHGSNCDAHRCAHIEMDKDAANLVFTLVESELLSTLRSRKGAGLRSDLKAIVDKTSDVLGDIDMTKYPRLSMNIDAIDDYLDGPSMPLFTHIEQALCADDATIVSTACLPVKKSISNVLSAHLTLPLVRAVTQHDHLLSRMRSGLSRAVEEYDNIIEDYKLNVALNPDSSEAWYQLGQAHSDLADELLLGTASEILSSRFDIAILQRSAISCAVQAKQLLPSLHGSSGSSSVDDGDNCLYEDTQQLRVRVYSFTSCLLYRIASKPLPLLALQILPSNVLVSDDNIDDEHQEWDIGIWKPSEQESPASCRKDGAAVASVAKSLTSRFTRAPPRHRVYSLARRLLVITSKLDADSWKCVYMLGKAMAKLHEPLSACACYLKAVYLAIASDGKHTSTAAGSAPCLAYADDSGSDIPVLATNHPIPMSSVPESAMSPTYKLLSSLAKLLHSSSLDVDTVARFLGSLPFSATNLPNAGSPDMKAKSVSTGSRNIAVFEAIYRLATQVCPADRRRWNHRLVYLLAWIEHTVFSNSDQAKQTLQTVLQTRSSNRLLSSFYKPDFEAPGKHYLYLEKYLGLYVETLVATSDIEGVQILLRKLKRCSGMFFDPSAMQLRVKTAEISTLNNMVRDLDCPRFVVDNLGKEHIVLQNALDGDSVAREYSVTRHCRLNRTQFNCARDFARDNISFYISFREHLNSAVSAIEKGRAETKKDDATEEDTAAILDPSNSSTDGPLGVVKGAQEAVNRYLCTATKAMALFDLLLEKKKKHFDDADTLSKLNDNLADIYILLLLTYGQERLSIVFHPHQSDDLGELADMCSRITAVISSHKDPKTTSGLFWQRVLFDEASNESSQQYKLLDPLLEFNVNKLLDSVRDARSLQPNPFVRSNPRSAQALAQPAPQPATTAASAGDQLPLAS